MPPTMFSVLSPSTVQLLIVMSEAEVRLSWGMLPLAWEFLINVHPVMVAGQK